MEMQSVVGSSKTNNAFSFVAPFTKKEASLFFVLHHRKA
jgi:hypothetical protein